jgi:hypothetical protein
MHLTPEGSVAHDIGSGLFWIGDAIMNFGPSANSPLRAPTAFNPSIVGQAPRLRVQQAVASNE